MRKLTYYAVFEPSAGGNYGVYWPDLPGCTSFGETLLHAEKMAIEALRMHVYQMEQDKEQLPPVTLPPFSEMPAGGIVMPVTIFPDVVKNEMGNKAVKTSITIPAWLKDWAGTQGINLSQTLQTTLREMYDTQYPQ